MTRDEFLDKQFELSVQAGMNQQHHQHYQTKWGWFDRGVKILTGIVAVGGAITAFSSSVELAATVSISAAFLAVGLNVLPFADWAGTHADFFRRWTDFREEIDSLLYDAQGDAPSRNHIKSLQRLEGKMHRICGQEPSRPNRKYRDKCFAAEMQSRQPRQDNEQQPSRELVATD